MKNRGSKIAIEQLVALRQAGFTDQQIAVKFGCSRQNVMQRLRGIALPLSDTVEIRLWPRRVVYDNAKAEAFAAGVRVEVIMLAALNDAFAPEES